MRYICCNKTKVFDYQSKKFLYRPCGKCVVCLQKKSALKSVRINREIAQNRFNWLLTLSYSSEECPYMYLTRNDDGLVQLKTSDNFVSSDLTEIGQPLAVCDFRNNYDSYRWLKNITDLLPDIVKDVDGVIYTKDQLTTHYDEVLRGLTAKEIHLPIINYYDVKIFFKTMRNRFIKWCKTNNVIHYSGQPFSYFVLAEYGAKFHRAHYHVVLHSNSRDFVKFLHSTLFPVIGTSSKEKNKRYYSSIWTKGTVNIQSIKTNGVSSYVSGYVSGLSSDKSIYSISEIRQRCKTSKFYGRPFGSDQLNLLRPFSEKSFQEFSELKLTELSSSKRKDAYTIYDAIQYIYPSIPFANSVGIYVTAELLSRIGKSSIGKRTRRHQFKKYFIKKIDNRFLQYIIDTTKMPLYCSDNYLAILLGKHLDNIYYAYLRYFNHLVFTLRIKESEFYSYLKRNLDFRADLNLRQLNDSLGSQQVDGFFESTYLTSDAIDNASIKSLLEAQASQVRQTNRKFHNNINYNL